MCSIKCGVVGFLFCYEFRTRFSQIFNLCCENLINMHEVVILFPDDNKGLTSHIALPSSVHIETRSETHRHRRTIQLTIDSVLLQFWGTHLVESIPLFKFPALFSDILSCVLALLASLLASLRALSLALFLVRSAAVHALNFSHALLPIAQTCDHAYISHTSLLVNL